MLSEVFLLGNWKDYQELEDNLSMPEITAILVAKRKDDTEHRKFLAALQGVDLDGASDDAQQIWEDKKAKFFSGGQAESANDILSLQGQAAAQAGFGIGNGLEYTDGKLVEEPSW